MKKCTAVAYFRTSSAANVGADKDSERQRETVEAYERQPAWVREVHAAWVAHLHRHHAWAVSGEDPAQLASLLHGT